MSSRALSPTPSTGSRLVPMGQAKHYVTSRPRISPRGRHEQRRGVTAFRSEESDGTRLLTCELATERALRRLTDPTQAQWLARRSSPRGPRLCDRSPVERRRLAQRLAHQLLLPAACARRCRSSRLSGGVRVRSRPMSRARDPRSTGSGRPPPGSGTRDSRRPARGWPPHRQRSPCRDRRGGGDSPRRPDRRDTPLPGNRVGRGPVG